ncbi:hypothetical protein M2T28_14130 [Elizabethkingia miricola]|uniref:hypothetical protein n=1 Tax=Elizabethkingia miricola TaxID=172045 RepID=UPI0020188ACD|nr:hypothetical protein [Elizabethkingia miricola]MCL1653758.1 hypothetical protein [Elizabethkingia miricola]
MNYKNDKQYKEALRLVKQGVLDTNGINTNYGDDEHVFEISDDLTVVYKTNGNKFLEVSSEDREIELQPYDTIISYTDDKIEEYMADTSDMDEFNYEQWNDCQDSIGDYPNTYHEL